MDLTQHSKFRLMAVETHPIQYKAPLFRHLASDQRFDFSVLYAMIPDESQQGAGFGVRFKWDVPLLDGYRYEVLENRAQNPSVTRFGGCDTPGIYSKLKALRPDVVLVNGWVVKTCLQTLMACRCLGIPCMVRGEANLLRPRPRWKHLLHRMLLRQYSAYLAIGSANRGFYQFHDCNEERIFHAPYAVDNRFFMECAERLQSQRVSLREKFNLRDSASVFLFVGKLEEKKHPLDLLAAVQMLPARLRDEVCIIMAGDGPLMSACRNYIRQHDLPIHMVGFLNQRQLPEMYAVSDVLVLPSDAGETWGLVVNEAMASGRPAIVSRLAGCCEDLIVEGETGFSFECGKIAELVNCMSRYLKDSTLAEMQGLRAAAHIQNYSLDAIADGVDSACRQIVVQL